MKIILLVLTLLVLNFEILLCEESINSTKKNISQSIENTNKNVMFKINTEVQEKSINAIFEDIVKVLHAPYPKNSLFFKIFKGKKQMNEKKKGQDAKIGEGSNDGNGTWSVKAGKNKNHDIIYEYKNYQCQGCNMIVNGKMLSMYRSKNRIGDDTLGFKGGKNINTPFIDTLTITTGDDKAILTFTYPFTSIHTNIAESTYEHYLFGCTGSGMFVSKGSKIELTYKGETMTLNKEQLKKLLIVNH